jgi:hypothetical protein
MTIHVVLKAGDVQSGRIDLSWEGEAELELSVGPFMRGRFLNMDIGILNGIAHRTDVTLHGADRYRRRYSAQAGVIWVTVRPKGSYHSSPIASGAWPAKGRISVRRHQMKLLEAGSVTMAVWLGKQFLGQRDVITGELATRSLRAFIEQAWPVLQPAAPFFRYVCPVQDCTYTKAYPAAKGSGA